MQVYCAILALLHPTKTSFASIAILQESSTGLVFHVNYILGSTERFRKNMKKIRDLYEAISYESDEEKKGAVEDKVSDLEDATLRAVVGIEFELEYGNSTQSDYFTERRCRDVSFTYPGSQTKKEALNNINLKIKSGQFVVLVGANGSGKSTLVKLLLRLYQPDSTNVNDTTNDDKQQPEKSSSPSILIDSIPASSYSESSLRRSMAVLSQDNVIYPGFSLGENIALGFAPLLSDTDALHEAAEKACAEEVLARMKDGANTVLDPLQDYQQWNVPKGHPFRKVLDGLRRPVEVSGGERQRIVAYVFIDFLFRY